jgi:hypothetical protein
MNNQLEAGLTTQEQVGTYVERDGIAFELFEPKRRAHILRQNGYGDNFATARRIAWTH